MVLVWGYLLNEAGVFWSIGLDCRLTVGVVFVEVCWLVGSFAVFRLCVFVVCGLWLVLWLRVLGEVGSCWVC
jgi:hypothetical protein